MTKMTDWHRLWQKWHNHRAEIMTNIIYWHTWHNEKITEWQRWQKLHNEKDDKDDRMTKTT